MIFIVLLGCSSISKIIKNVLPNTQNIESPEINPTVVNPRPSQTIQFSGKIVDGWYIDEQHELRVPIADGTFEVGQKNSNRKP